jgi:hypothetical protein
VNDATSLGTRGSRRALDAALVALCPVVIAIHPLANNDLPMHLAVGEWILEHGTLPARDPFSFTAGHPAWVPHEWLASLLFVAFERAGGLVALVALAAGLAASLALVHRAVMARLGVGLTTHLLWALPMWLVAGERIVLRPHLPALVLTFAVWWCLLRARDDARSLALLPVLLAVWVNLHGSFLMGFGIVGLDLVVFGRRHPVPWRPRLLAIAACGAAFFAQLHVYFQPSLLAGVEDALGLLRDPVFMHDVVEWQAPFSSALFRETFAFHAAIPWMVLAAVGFVRRGPRLPPSYRVFAVVALLLYLRHARFVDLMALSSLPFLPDLDPSPARCARRRAWCARGAILVAVLLCIRPGLPIRPGQHRPPALRWGYDLPFSAVDALLARGYEGGVFCEYKFGGVVAWRSRGRLQPSMDSRNSVYGADLYLAHSEAILRDTPFRRELLERVGAVLILRPTPRRDRRNLIEHLMRAKSWQLAHVDRRSLLFVKAPPPAGGSRSEAQSPRPDSP